LAHKYYFGVGEKKGSFLHGIGAVGYNKGVNIVLRQQNIDALSEGQHDVQGPVLRSDNGIFSALMLARFLMSGTAANTAFNGHRAGSVARLGSRGCYAGNGSSSCQDCYVGKLCFPSGRVSANTEKKQVSRSRILWSSFIGNLFHSRE
jgi:hypothetical protein